jgi:hypothetical protein
MSILNKLTAGELTFLIVIAIIAAATVLIAFAEAIGKRGRCQRAGDQAVQMQTRGHDDA